MTTFTGFGGAACFFGSGLTATGGGGGGGATALGAVTGAVGLAVGAGAGWNLAVVCVFEMVPDTEFGFPGNWAFPEAACGLGLGPMDLELLDTGAFFEGTDTDFFNGAGGATFLATGLAVLLAAGPFFTGLWPPDEWAGFEAAFLAGAIFLTFTVFFTGLAAFFLVAIQLGFFSNKHF
jgi:hypothetical protein